MLNGKPSILFLSTGDATRSRMAGAFFRKLVGEKFDVICTAVDAAVSHPLASVAMTEAGIDISSALSISIADTLKRGFTCVITICDASRERHPIFPFTPRLVHWSIEDPVGSERSADRGLELIRRVRDDIAGQVSRFIAGTGPTAVSPLREWGLPQLNSRAAVTEADSLDRAERHNGRSIHRSIASPERASSHLVATFTAPR